MVPERRADPRGLDVPDPGASVPRARARPVHDRTALGCTVVLPRRVRRRGDARPDRASPRRGAGGRPDDAEAHHGPRSGHVRAGTTPARCGWWCAAAPRSTRGSRARSWTSSGRCSTTCTDPPRWPGRRSRRRDDLLEAPGTVGRPPPHTRLEILDEDGHPLPPGSTGHIFVAHEMLFEGYTDPRTATRVEGEC